MMKQIKSNPCCHCQHCLCFLHDRIMILQSVRPSWECTNAMRCAEQCTQQRASGNVFSTCRDTISECSSKKRMVCLTCIGAGQDSSLWAVSILVRKEQQRGICAVNVAGHHGIAASSLHGLLDRPAGQRVSLSIITMHERLTWVQKFLSQCADPLRSAQL